MDVYVVKTDLRRWVAGQRQRLLRFRLSCSRTGFVRLICLGHQIDQCHRAVIADLAVQCASDIDLKQIDLAGPQGQESCAKVNVQIRRFVAIGVCDAKTLDGLFADPPKIEVVERYGSVYALLEYAAHNALSDSPIHKRWGERYKQRKHDEQNADTPRQLLDRRSWFGVGLGHRNVPKVAATGGSPSRIALGMVFAVGETGTIRRP